jgi:hypothetical protein
MVESNHAEERLSRIAHMVEDLHREQLAHRLLAAKLVNAVAVLKPSAVVTYRRRNRKP